MSWRKSAWPRSVIAFKLTSDFLRWEQLILSTSNNVQHWIINKQIVESQKQCKCDGTISNYNIFFSLYVLSELLSASRQIWERSIPLWIAHRLAHKFTENDSWNLSWSLSLICWIPQFTYSEIRSDTSRMIAQFMLRISLLHFGINLHSHYTCSFLWRLQSITRWLLAHWVELVPILSTGVVRWLYTLFRIDLVSSQIVFKEYYLLDTYIYGAIHNNCPSCWRAGGFD